MKGWFTFLMLLLVPSALAANSLLTIPETVTVDFSGERAFTLQFPSGDERQFTWLENETHSDVTFDHTFYYPFTEENYCNNTVRFAETYRNMTNTLSGLVTTCQGVLAHLNSTINATENLTNEALAAQRDRDEYLRRYLIAETHRALAENATADVNASVGRAETERDAAVSARDSYKSQYDTCSSQLSSVRAPVTVAQNTDTALKSCQDSKQTSMIVAGVIGLIAGYLFGRRGKGGGPSEQAQVGAHGDRPRLRDVPS